MTFSDSASGRVSGPTTVNPVRSSSDFSAATTSLHSCPSGKGGFSGGGQVGAHGVVRDAQADALANHAWQPSAWHSPTPATAPASMQCQGEQPDQICQDNRRRATACDMDLRGMTTATAVPCSVSPVGPPSSRANPCCPKNSTAGSADAPARSLVAGGPPGPVGRLPLLEAEPLELVVERPLADAEQLGRARGDCRRRLERVRTIASRSSSASGRDVVGAGCARGAGLEPDVLGVDRRRRRRGSPRARARSRARARCRGQRAPSRRCSAAGGQRRRRALEVARDRARAALRASGRMSSRRSRSGGS